MLTWIIVGWIILAAANECLLLWAYAQGEKIDVSLIVTAVLLAPLGSVVILIAMTHYYFTRYVPRKRREVKARKIEREKEKAEHMVPWEIEL